MIIKENPRFSPGSFLYRRDKKHSFKRTSVFLSKPTGLVYHHDAVVYIIAVGVYHHTKCAFLSAWWYTTSSDVDDMQFLRNWWYTTASRWFISAISYFSGWLRVELTIFLLNLICTHHTKHFLRVCSQNKIWTFFSI